MEREGEWVLHVQHSLGPLRNKFQPAQGGFEPPSLSPDMLNRTTLQAKTLSYRDLSSGLDRSSWLRMDNDPGGCKAQSTPFCYLSLDLLPLHFHTNYESIREAHQGSKGIGDFVCKRKSVGSLLQLSVCSLPVRNVKKINLNYTSVLSIRSS